MPKGNEPPEVLPSAPDEEYECVLVDPEAARAPTAEEPAPGRCPPGYVPRLKRRGSYRLHGKEAVTGDPPQRNPHHPQHHLAHDPEGRTGDAHR
jgi:hypothetical protein